MDEEHIRLRRRGDLRGLRHRVLFFFNDTATTEIYTLSLHDALPISFMLDLIRHFAAPVVIASRTALGTRSEEHTSELQSPCNLVCRLLLEKKSKSARRVLPPSGRHARHLPPSSGPAA